VDIIIYYILIQVKIEKLKKDVSRFNTVGSVLCFKSTGFPYILKSLTTIDNIIPERNCLAHSLFMTGGGLAKKGVVRQKRGGSCGIFD
jgi:hypothetical protein